MEPRPGVVGACDMCRRKKIRCQPTSQGCTQCTKCGTSCHFTPISLKKRPRRPNGFKYIAQLEERLLEVETLLKDKPLAKPTAPDIISHEGQTTHAAPFNLAVPLESPNGRNRWVLGSELQHTGLENTNEAEHNLATTSMVINHSEPDLSVFGGHVNNSSWLRPASLPHAISFSMRQQLPTKEIALELVNEAFRNYFRFFPLFNEVDFLEEFHLKYSISSPEDAGWWACLNVVLSVAHRLRSLRTLDPKQDNALACGYLYNALSVVSVLHICDGSLSAVQALAGMACILQGTPNPKPAAALAAAALRLAQAMKLHRECFSPELTELQAENRRRVFWKVYILDKDISLRTRRPFAQDDDDMDVNLPSQADFESINLNIFNCRIGLAIIQGQVYKQLYSTQAERKTAAQRGLAAEELSRLLSHWKSKTQLDLGEEPTGFPGLQLSGESIHQLVLQLIYMHCLTMIDHHLPEAAESSLLSNQGLGWPIPLSGRDSVCVAESRKVMRLVEFVPQGDSSCVWMLLHAFFAAASSMLRHLTRYPMSPNAKSDIHLVKPFLRLMETLAGDPNILSQSDELMQMRRNGNSLNNEAEMAIQLSALTSPTGFT